jgi:hypothetical protein
MKIFLLFILALTCAGLLYRGIKDCWRIYEFPFLAGATFTGFAFPQFYGLITATDLPSGSYEKAVVMTILCALATLIGYNVRQSPKRSNDLLAWKLDQRRLVIAGAALPHSEPIFLWL